VTIFAAPVVSAQPPRVEVQAVAATGSMPKGVSLSPDGKHAYVTNFGQSNGKNVDVFDAETLAHEATIDLPGNVVESVLSPDGTTLYASNFLRNSVMFVDLKTRKVTREIATGLHPKILVPSPDGNYLFAANWSGRSVTQIDIASGKAVRTLGTTD
jgi:YVTN family beta-propeller protein